MIAVAAGLGMGAAGAGILAAGVLNSPATMARQSTQSWNFSPPLAEAFARNRADAEIGVASLAIGFFVQLVGAAWRGGDPAPAAVLIAAVIPAALIVAAWRVIRPYRAQHLLGRIDAERAKEDE